jgi:pyruvate/2-oxoglutarate/acetoin dehydrogenase E1 component
MAVREISYAQALNEALHEEMSRDPDVFIMGEEVASGGGVKGITKDLLEKFGKERVRNTPISEAAIVGAGLGAALTGSRPVVELMFMDLICLAMDQIVNQVAKVNYMFGGKARAALVIRFSHGAGHSAAAQHSQSLEAWLVHTPGLIVVAPSTPYDAKGLLKTSIREDNPVIFLEHNRLYTTKGPVPEEEYLIPLGVADVKRRGRDVTIVATCKQVLNSLAAGETLAKYGIEIEVIDPRTLKPLDEGTILQSVRRTHRLVVVTEDCKTGSYASEVAATMGELAFDFLDAPITRVTGKDVPIPANPRLETAAIPQVQDIVSAVGQVMGVEIPS